MRTYRCLYDSLNYIPQAFSLPSNRSQAARSFRGRYIYVAEENGKVGDFIQYGGNNPIYILTCVSEVFAVRIVSEHEPEYWGFKTQAEWDADSDARAKKHSESFALDLSRYVRDEPNDIRPGTVGHSQAEIAKELVSAEPHLSDPEMRHVLRERVEKHYMTGHVVKVQLTEEDIAT